jgi:hypothetical protein
VVVHCLSEPPQLSELHSTVHGLPGEKKLFCPIDLLKYCFILAGGFSDARTFFLLFCSAFFRLTTPGKVTTAFWKLHLMGVVQSELPFSFFGNQNMEPVS